MLGVWLNIYLHVLQIVCKALACGSQALLWYLNKLDETNPNKDEMRALRKRLNDMMKYCHELLFHQQDKVGEEVRGREREDRYLGVILSTFQVFIY